MWPSFPLLFQDPNCHSCGLGQMHALVPCMHPECQGHIYPAEEVFDICIRSRVQRARLRGNTWLRGYLPSLLLTKY